MNVVVLVATLLAAERARLVGQTVVDRAGGYTIVDVAGLGRPKVGVIEYRGDAPWLIPTDQDAGQPPVRLAGPLAVPRLLAPGYKVWVLSPPPATGTLTPTRFGVLARPSEIR